jgi:hypothetical protein
MTILSS